MAHLAGNGAEAAYWRSDLLEKRRKLMADWAEFVVLKVNGTTILNNIELLEAPRRHIFHFIQLKKFSALHHCYDIPTTEPQPCHCSVLAVTHPKSLLSTKP